LSTEILTIVKQRAMDLTMSKTFVACHKIVTLDTLNCHVKGIQPKMKSCSSIFYQPWSKKVR